MSERSHRAEVRPLYPVMLDLTGEPCVVIGGGRVGERKAAGLLAAGADVTVVSPRLTPRLSALAAEGRIRALLRPYAPGLAALAEARLVFAATDDAAVNKAVLAEARKLGKLANAADAPEASGFHVPAVVRRGRLTLAVATAGASPAVAAKLKRQLEAAYGEEYAPYLELLHELRGVVQQRAAGAARSADGADGAHGAVPAPAADGADGAVPASAADGAHGARGAARADIFRAMLDWPLPELLRAGRLTPERRAQLVDMAAAEPTAEGMGRIARWLNSLLPDNQ